MNAADVIRMLMEMDQQIVSPRPSHLGRAAEIVAPLCRDHESADSSILGDWKSISLEQVRERPSGELDQPTMALGAENDRLRCEVEALRAEVERLKAGPAAIVAHWDDGEEATAWHAFGSVAEAEAFATAAEFDGLEGDQWTVYEIGDWTWHPEGGSPT